MPTQFFANTARAACNFRRRERSWLFLSPDLARESSVGARPQVSERFGVVSEQVRSWFGGRPVVSGACGVVGGARTRPFVVNLSLN